MASDYKQLQESFTASRLSDIKIRAERSENFFMITFSYDETDGFETKKAEPAFIAGAIYDSKKEKEYHGVACERARLEAYFRAVCADCKNNNVRFPRDLHRMPLGEKKDNKLYESEVKKILRASLAEFLSKGTYKGKELLFLNDQGELIFEQKSSSKPVQRRGRYQFIAVQKGDDSDIPENAQVYFEMVKSIIHKAIYTNNSLLSKNQPVYINAPTRVLPDDKITEDIKKKFSRQGYRFENSKKLWFVLESGDIRGITADFDTSLCLVDPVLFIRKSKDGYALGNNDHAGVQDFAFLFLADALCSFFQEKLYGIVQKQSLISISKALREVDQHNLIDSDRLILKENIKAVDNAIKNECWLSQFQKSNQLKCEELQKLFQSLKRRNNFNKSKITSSEYADALLKAMRLLNSSSANKVYIYDKFTIDLDSVNNNIINGEYFTALSKLYDYKMSCETHSGNNTYSLYEKEIANNLKAHVNRSTLKKAIKNLDEYRLRQMDEVVAFQPDRLNYIFEEILYLADSLTDAGKDITLEQKAKLYDIGISAATHIGDTVRAYGFYKKYMAAKGIDLSADGLPVELNGLSDETLRTINRALTDYHDFFDYERTEKDACKLLGVRTRTSLLSKLKKILTGKQQTGLRKKDLKLKKPLCFITSTLGQTYAFLNDPLAEVYFKEALDALYKKGMQEQEPDYYITVSYLLQWYIEQKNQPEYESLAKSFFGEFDSISEQLDYLLRKGVLDYEQNTVSSYPEYALFIFIKAFYTFYKDDPDNRNVLIKLTHLDQTVAGFVDRLIGHPWEIIFKYAALLEEYDKSVKVGTNIKKAAAAVRPVGVVGLVVQYGELEYRENRIAHGHVNRQSLESLDKNYIVPLWNKIKDTPEIPAHWTETDGDAAYKREQLRKMFSYMYH